MFGKEKQTKNDFEMFTVYDTKVGIYKEPVLAINRYDILRQISNLFTDPKQVSNQLVSNAEDFSLFKIGEFSKQNGTIIPCQHEHIANLHDLKTAALHQYNAEQLNPVGINPT